MFKLMREDKKLFKKALKIILFISFSQMIMSAVGFLDVLMTSRYGENDFAAIGVAAEIWFIFQAPMIAFSTLFGILYSQYQKNNKNFNELVKVNIIFAFILTVFVSLAMIFLSKYLIGAFFAKDTYSPENSKEIQDLVYKYILILSIGNIFATAGLHLINPIIMIRDQKYILWMALIALGINGVFNYVFIYALSLGAVGAGISTTISYVAEFVFAVVIVYKNKELFKGLSKIFNINKNIAKSVFKRIGIAFSSIVMFWSYALSTLLINIEYGSKVMQSLSIAYTISGIMFSIMPAIRKSTNIIIGGSLGESDFTKAKSDSVKLSILVAILGVFFSVVSVGLAFTVPQFTIKNSELVYKAKIMIIIFGASILGYIMQTYYSSIIESSGKTLIPAIFNYWIPLWLQIPLIIFMGPWFVGLKFEHMFLVQSLAIYIAPFVLVVVKRKYRWLINLNKEIVYK